MTLTSLTQYARHPGATQSSLLQSARQPASDEKHNTEVEEKKAVPAPKKKRKKKHGITANLSGTRYEVSKYLSSGPFLSVYGAEMPIPPPPPNVTCIRTSHNMCQSFQFIIFEEN